MIPGPLHAAVVACVASLAVPTALRAQPAWTPSGNNLFFTGGNIGIGTSTPQWPLTVTGTGQRAFFGLNSATTGANYGGLFQSNSTQGRGLYGFAASTTGANFGVQGLTSSNAGTGVFGFASSATGSTFGVWGRTASPDGYAGFFEGRGYFAGNVGIGLQNPSQKLDVAGTIAVSGIPVISPTGQWLGSPTGLIGPTGSPGATGATGVQGIPGATGATGPMGVTGPANGGPWVVNGSAISYTAGNVGVGTATPGARIDVVAAAGQNSNAIQGATASPQGFGILGSSTATSGPSTGVVGTSTSPAGVGVNGQTTATTGTAIGVLGVTASPGGAGVQGENNSTTGTGPIGVQGIAAAPSGTGVWGSATSTTGAASGVIGETSSSTGWGVYAYGDIGSSGTKSFQIDHPLDPAGKYLVHFCTESPEPYLIYRGNVTLDGAGSAWVQLPDYFEALNRDPQYALTPIGAPASLYIASEVKNNRFQIAGGRPNMKVSWTVTGIRNDAYVQAYLKPTEQEKPAEVRGLYLNPELFGMPPEFGIHYHARVTPRQPATPAVPTR
jgi:hypothetical protein